MSLVEVFERIVHGSDVIIMPSTAQELPDHLFIGVRKSTGKLGFASVPIFILGPDKGYLNYSSNRIQNGMHVVGYRHFDGITHLIFDDKTSLELHHRNETLPTSIDYQQVPANEFLKPREGS